MIRPGLFTASTNKADHLGTSGAGLEWCCIGSVLLSLRVVLVWGLKQCFPLVGTLGHEWVPERYGQFATSRLDESLLLAVRKVSEVLWCPSSVGCLLSLVLKMRFPPSVVKSKHGWRTAMHL